MSSETSKKFGISHLAAALLVGGLISFAITLSFNGAGLQGRMSKDISSASSNNSSGQTCDTCSLLTKAKELAGFNNGLIAGMQDDINNVYAMVEDIQVRTAHTEELAGFNNGLIAGMQDDINNLYQVVIEIQESVADLK